MRFTRIVATAAVLTAITLSITSTAHAQVNPGRIDADPPTSHLANLAVTGDGGAWAFDVTNSGDATSAPCMMRLRWSTGQVIELRLFTLNPGSTFRVAVPRSIDMTGTAVFDPRQISVMLEVDFDNRVRESNERDNRAALSRAGAAL